LRGFRILLGVLALLLLLGMLATLRLILLARLILALIVVLVRHAMKFLSVGESSPASITAAGISRSDENFHYVAAVPVRNRTDGWAI